MLMQLEFKLFVIFNISKMVLSLLLLMTDDL